MTLTPLTAHLACAGLVVVDLVARAWRIQWFFRGLGHRIRFRDAFTLNAYGDAACAVTPLRIGGEPARLAGAVRAGVPAEAAAVGILIEVLCAWPVILVTAGILALRFAPQWWRTLGPAAGAAMQRGWPVLLLVAALSVLAWVAGRRLARRFPMRRQQLRRAAVYWRRMPAWPILASVPLSFLNLATRTFLLPLLLLTAADPPPLGPALLGSFALLYSQLVLPTPSGAGAVDVGVLGGVAGHVGAGQEWLLLAWRMYSNGVGVLLGALLAVRFLGWPAVRKLLRSTAASALQADAAVAPTGTDDRASAGDDPASAGEARPAAPPDAMRGR